MRDNLTLECKAVFFDAGNTLIRRKPSDDEVLVDRLHRIGLEASSLAAHHAVKQAELWTGIQTQREMRGAPRMPDAELFRSVDQAALRSLYPLASENEVSEWALCLERLPKIKRN